MGNEAVGILEVYGLVTALCCADAGVKAGNVWLEKFDKNKPKNPEQLAVPLLVCVKFRGQVADVTAAMEAAMAKAEEMSGYVQHHIIPNPTDDTVKMLGLCAFDKR